jgi:glycosyltransferase involved in cell wall biosynthesis
MSRSRKKITLLTEYFYPEEASTAQLLTSLATGLQGRFDVSVITGQPNYHSGDEEASVSPRETHKGVSIERLPATRLDKDTLFFRVINWITFCLLVFLRLVRSRGKDEVVLVLSNPPVLPFAVWAAKRIRGFSYAYLIYDMYPDFPVALNMVSANNPIVKIWERAMRMVYRDADRIVVLGDSMKRRLTSKMSRDLSFSPDKIEVIPNWEDGDFIKPVPKAENSFAQKQGLLDSFTLLYSGNIGRFHELRTAIDAIRLLEDRGRDDIQFVVIGEGARKQEHRHYVQRHRIENVHFFPFQPLDRLPETLTACDASLVGIIPEVEGLCVSSKLYSALAAGRPILAVVGEDDEVSRVVIEEECGAHVRPGDAGHAAETLASWADQPDAAATLGRRARTAFETKYTRSQAVKAYERLFDQMHGQA